MAFHFGKKKQVEKVDANCIELCFIMNSIIHITLVIAVNASVLNNSDIPYP